MQTWSDVAGDRVDIETMKRISSFAIVSSVLFKP